MAETWSTFWMSTPRLVLLREEVLEGGVGAEAGLLRNQRSARKPTIATAISCGMLIEVCVSAILAGRCLVASWRVWGGGLEMRCFVLWVDSVV